MPLTADEYRAEAHHLSDLARRIYAEHEPLNDERVDLARTANRTPEQTARLSELERSPLFGYFRAVDEAAKTLIRAAEWADRQAVKA